jgi:hypothetical protein
MCRSIKTPYDFEPPAGDEEIHSAALQFVRKVSGFRKPSKFRVSGGNFWKWRVFRQLS